jgi:hypothetical protein
VRKAMLFLPSCLVRQILVRFECSELHVDKDDFLVVVLRIEMSIPQARRYMGLLTCSAASGQALPFLEASFTFVKITERRGRIFQVPKTQKPLAILRGDAGYRMFTTVVRAIQYSS